MQFKEEEDRRRAEQAKKKAEAKALLEKEMNSIQTTAKIPQSKITRAQIEAEVEKRNKAIEAINNPPKPVLIFKITLLLISLLTHNLL